MIHKHLNFWNELCGYLLKYIPNLLNQRSYMYFSFMHFCFFHRSTRLASFPDFLFIQLKKFTLGDDWVPKKLGKSVSMCDLCVDTQMGPDGTRLEHFLLSRAKKPI